MLSKVEGLGSPPYLRTLATRASTRGLVPRRLSSSGHLSTCSAGTPWGVRVGAARTCSVGEVGAARAGLGSPLSSPPTPWGSEPWVCWCCAWSCWSSLGAWCSRWELFRCLQLQRLAREGYP